MSGCVVQGVNEAFLPSGKYKKREAGIDADPRNKYNKI